jgi:hypothetical protein
MKFSTFGFFGRTKFSKSYEPARGGDGGVREELAQGALMTFETVVAECPQSRTNRKTLARSEHYWF